MIERAARALMAYHGQNVSAITWGGEPVLEQVKREVRVVIEAMRAPSEDMEAAADDPFWAAMRQAREWAEKYGKPIGYASAAFSEPMWRAMIDAALCPPSQGANG